MIEQGSILDETYKIIKSIGSGGGGEIYLADHLRLEKMVVVKKIKDNVKGLIADRGEADVLKRLRHPYLPQVLDYFVENNQVYTVMEYIEGENFQQLLESGRKFATKDIIKWGTQLSEVLAYLHGQKPPIIHRDIKPANIMLTPEGDIRLIDFNVSVDQKDYVNIQAHSDGYSPLEQYGIIRSGGKPQAGKSMDIETDGTEFIDVSMQRKETEEDTQLLINPNEETLCGNETEILNEDDVQKEIPPVDGDQVSVSSMERKYEVLPMVDERSDIYSLGATLYHMATRKRPEKATGRVTPFSECCGDVGDGLVYIIEKAMQGNPAKRFRSADKMHNAFVNIKKMDHEYVSYAFRRDILFGLVIVAVCCSMVCTILGYKKMKAEAYDAYVVQIEKADGYALNGQMQEACETCELAIEMRPDDLIAYVELVHIYYMWQKYEEGIAEVEQLDFDIRELTEETRNQWTTLQFLAGECYMEQGEFKLAAECYKKAIEFCPSEGEYYTRCAIALARAGDQEGAEVFLEDALQRGISDAALYITKAEIMLGEKKYEEAEALIYKVLGMTDDSDICYHAYLTAARVYEDGVDVIADAAEKEKELLETAVGRLERSYSLSLSEKLGDVYYELAGQEKDTERSVEYYEKALECFNDIYRSGYHNFHVMQNMAIINQTLGHYEEAETVLLDMVEIYPEDYRGYMYLTLLYTEIQNEIPVEKRDYSVIFEYYDRAESLYQRKLNSGGGMDANMQILGNMVEGLRGLAD